MIHNARNEVRNEEGCGLINPCCSGVACSWSDSRGAAAEESPATRLSINADPVTESARAEAVRLALRELGYVEGQNIATDYRYAEGKPDRFPELAAELARLKVDIIVTAGGIGPVRAAKNATKTIPIVMSGTGVDPSRRAWLKALPVPAATSPALHAFPEN